MSWVNPWKFRDQRDLGNGLSFDVVFQYDTLTRIMGQLRDASVKDWAQKWKDGTCVGCTTRSAYGDSWEWVHVDSCPTHGAKAEKLIAEFLLAEGKWDWWKIVRRKSSGYDDVLLRGTRAECDAFLESFDGEGYHGPRMVPMKEPVTE